MTKLYSCVFRNSSNCDLDEFRYRFVLADVFEVISSFGEFQERGFVIGCFQRVIRFSRFVHLAPKSDSKGVFMKTPFLLFFRFCTFFAQNCSLYNQDATFKSLYLMPCINPVRGPATAGDLYCPPKFGPLPKPRLWYNLHNLKGGPNGETKTKNLHP